MVPSRMVGTTGVTNGLAEYQPYWAARAALLARAQQHEAAAEAYGRAIGLATDPAVRRFLQGELERAAPSPAQREREEDH